MFELLFNPFAGAAGFNLIAFMVYVTLALCAFVAVLERSISRGE